MISNYSKKDNSTLGSDITYTKPGYLFKLVFFYSALAILITSLMDHNGLIIFSALPLLGLIGLFKIQSKMSLKELGFHRGQNTRLIVIAILYPLLAMGSILTIMLLTNNLEISRINSLNFSSIIIDIIIISIISTIMIIITEEGFFRGILWTGFKKSGVQDTNNNLLTAILFSLWHISLITSNSEFRLEGFESIIYLTNVLFLGLIWGLFRNNQNSVISASVSHSVWNSVGYTLFGFGDISGLLSYNSEVFSPETGYLGLSLNIIAYLILKRVLTSPVTVTGDISILVRVDINKISEFVKYVEIEEFHAIIKRNLEMKNGELYVDNLQNPSIMIYNAKVIHYVGIIRENYNDETIIKMMAQNFKSNKIFITNSDKIKTIANSYFFSRILKFPNERELFSSEHVDYEFLKQELDDLLPISANFSLRKLTTLDSKILSNTFKNYFNMIDSIGDILTTDLVFGVFENNKLIGATGPTHVPIDHEFEGQLVVAKNYRKKKLGYLLIYHLILESKKMNLRMIWDAENKISAKMARKLGYTSIKKYQLTIISNVWFKILFSLGIDKIIAKLND